MHCRNCGQRPALPTARGAAAHDGHLAVGTTISTTTCWSQCSDDHCAAERHDEFLDGARSQDGRGRVLTDIRYGNGFSRPFGYSSCGRKFQKNLTLAFSSHRQSTQPCFPPSGAYHLGRHARRHERTRHKPGHKHNKDLCTEHEGTHADHMAHTRATSARATQEEHQVRRPQFHSPCSRIASPTSSGAEGVIGHLCPLRLPCFPRSLLRRWP